MVKAAQVCRNSTPSSGLMQHYIGNPREEKRNRNCDKSQTVEVSWTFLLLWVWMAAWNHRMGATIIWAHYRHLLDCLCKSVDWLGEKKLSYQLVLYFQKNLNKNQIVGHNHLCTPKNINYLFIIMLSVPFSHSLKPSISTPHAYVSHCP